MSLYGVTIASFQDRFWAKVDKTGECWLWTGYKNPAGYSRFSIGYKGFYIHRLSLEMSLGRELQSGLFACHSCRNRHCVNPAHLREDTPKENTADAVRGGSIARGSRQGKSKLTEEQVRTIKLDDRTSSVIAAEYGVSLQNICCIRKGKTWAWL